MLVRVKGFQIFEDRGGRMRCYHRATRTAVNLVTNPIGSAGFLSECSRITALADKASPKAAPGTLGGLLKAYRAHSAFMDLAARTKSDYLACADYLAPIADTPLRKFTPPLVVKIRDKAVEKRGRRGADQVKAFLSTVFSWGLERGHMKMNPAKGVRALGRAKGAPEANRPWSDAERHAMLDAMPAHMLPALTLMLFVGLDPGDTLKLPRSAIKDGFLNTQRAKTGEPVWLPLPEPVLLAIEAAPKHRAVTVCANSAGKPWTLAGYRASWRPIRMRLELAGAIGKGLTLKGCRHTVATILAELGYDNRSIADVLGQRTEAMAAHYSRRADRTKKNTATIASYSLELERRRGKVVKPAAGTVKSAESEEPEA